MGVQSEKLELKSLSYQPACVFGFVRRRDTLGRISAIFTNGNFCEYLLVFLDTEYFWKCGLLWKERISSSGANSFLFRVD